MYSNSQEPVVSIFIHNAWTLLLLDGTGSRNRNSRFHAQYQSDDFMKKIANHYAPANLAYKLQSRTFRWYIFSMGTIDLWKGMDGNQVW